MNIYENKIPLFHVLNYAKGGFIIVSADLRTVPVLAFADEGIWVCDGIEVHEYSEYNCDTHSCNTWGADYYHMN